LKGNARQSAIAVKNIVGKYRPDLVAAALARVSRIVASQKPAKVVKPKKVRGKKN
jgi:large subunit ribosomal protein L28e